MKLTLRLDPNRLRHWHLRLAERLARRPDTQVSVAWHAAGEPLPDWHYLVSGSRETVHEAGQSTRGWTVSEDDAGELEYHVVERTL